MVLVSFELVLFTDIFFFDFLFSSFFNHSHFTILPFYPFTLLPFYPFTILPFYYFFFDKKKVMHKVQVDNLHVQFVPQARNVKILVLVTQKVFLLHVLIVILVIIKMNKGKTIANRARLGIILELLPQLRVVPIVILANTRSVAFLLQ